MKNDLNDLISIAEAARIRGVTHAAIQDLIKRNKLEVTEIGGRRFLSRKEVEIYEPEQPLGRPPKDKTQSTISKTTKTKQKSEK